MKHILTVSAAVLLAACGENAPELPGADVEVPSVDMPGEDEIAKIEEGAVEPPPVYNEEIWNISDFWPGEYPPGFSVLEEGVSVRARPVMHDSAVKTLSCALPQNATYQTWNVARAEADNLKFISMTEKFDITMTADKLIEGDTETGFVKLDLKAGDTLTYLTYFGEGFAGLQYKGQEVGIQMFDLQDVSDVETAGKDSSPEKLWIEVPCEDGKRGWLLYDEVIQEEAVVASPIIGYGEARDLTEQDRKDAIEQERYNETAPPADASED